MFHADVILGVACRPRMIFQAGAQLLAARLAIVRLLGARRMIDAAGGKQRQHDGEDSHDCFLFSFDATPRPPSRR
jgi:hypothetical protein